MLKRMICWALSLCAVLSLAVFPARAAESHELTVFLFLRCELGFNEAAACGVMASIEAESCFEPTAYNPAGYYGLCQWGGERQQRLYAFCAENGLDAASLEGQLQFMKHDLETAETAALAVMRSVENTAEGAYQAGWAWAETYERCAGSHYAYRAGVAQTSYWPVYEGYPLPEEVKAEPIEIPESRGDYVTYLWELKGAPQPRVSACPFADVTSADDCYKAVLWAVQNGIVQAKGEFHPDDPCTRAELITLLWHTNGTPAEEDEGLYTGASCADTLFPAALKDIVG